MFQDSKSLFSSATFWGLALTVTAPISARLGFVLPVDTAGVANDIATGIGALLAVYGRVRATQPVHILPK